MNQVVQAKAINLGLSLKDLLLMIYIKDTFIYKEYFVSAEIINDNPIIFASASEIKKSIEILETTGIINLLEWNKGKFKIEVDKNMVRDLFALELVELKKADRTVIRKKVEKKENPEEWQIIIDYYNSFDVMPVCKSVTTRREKALKEALSKHSIDDIKNAIEYALRQHWVLNKKDEGWMDIAWILNKTEDFLEGGQYRKNETKTKASNFFSDDNTSATIIL